MLENNLCLFIPFTDAPIIERSLNYVRSSIETTSDLAARIYNPRLSKFVESDIECLRYLESILLRCLPE